MTSRKTTYQNGSKDERQTCKLHTGFGFQDDCDWCWKAHLRLGKITEVKQLRKKARKP